MDVYRLVTLVLVSVLLGLGAGCESCGPTEEEPDAGDGGPRECLHDLFNGPEQAGELEPVEGGDGFGASGYVCPVQDRDWYRLEVPEGDRLLFVTLGIHGPASPVQPTYAVYACDEACVADPPADGTASCCEARAAPDAAEVGQAAAEGRPLAVTHCLDPGEYYIVVRDQGDDSQDGLSPRGEYTLTITTGEEPDDLEPNDDADAPSSLEPAGAGSWRAEGYVACRGDQDWYALDAAHGVEVPDGYLLEVHLLVPLAGFQPQYRVLGPEDLHVATETNAAGSTTATDLSGLYWLEQGGQFFVVVEDDDGSDADPSVPYTLTVTLVEDPDENEPNNTTERPTEVTGMSCGGGSERELTAYLSATNDIDVYEVAIPGGCARGVLEAEVTFDGSRPDGLEPLVRIVRPHAATTCAEDTDCGTLTLECDPDLEEDPDGLDCSGFGNSCRSEGRCAGASLCLDGRCGANIISRHPDYCGSSGHCHGPSGAMENRDCTVDSDCAEQGRVNTAVPLDRTPNPAVSSLPGVVYVIVQDFGADSSSLDASYEIRIATRSDPDTNEPNEIYTNVLTADSDDRDFDGVPTLAWGGCATGYLSYERDVDYFRIPHPCPGGPPGCDVHLTYDIGGGPVDVVAGTGFWGDIVEIGEHPEDLPSQDPRDGDYGGPGECVFANTRFPAEMLLGVRDLDFVRDYSATQLYEICLVGWAACTTWGCYIGFGGDCYDEPE